MCKSNGFTLVAFVGGLVSITATGLSRTNFGDATDYIQAGTSILNGDPYPREGSLPFFRPPGYPLAIAIVWNFFGLGDVAVLKLLNVLLHVLTTYLVFKICECIFGKSKSQIAAFVYGLNPLSLYQLGSVSTEPLTAFLFLLFIYGVTSKNKLGYFILPLTTVWLIFTRPEFALVVVPILLFLIWRRHRTGKTAIQVSLSLAVLSFCVLIWGSMNERSTGHFIPLTDATNYHLWMGSLDVIRDNYNLSHFGNSKFDEEQFERLLNEIDNRKKLWGDIYSEGDLIDRSKLWWRAYLENVQNQGILRYTELLVLKGLVFWRPFLNPLSYDILTLLTTFPIIFLFTISFFVGAWRFRNNSKIKMVLGCYVYALSVLTIVHMLQLPDMRYRVPIFVPISAILFGALIEPQIRRAIEFRRRMRDLNPR